MAYSSASKSCAVPSLCLRSVLEFVEDFLLARLASVYVSSIDNSRVSESSQDGLLVMVVILMGFDMSVKNRTAMGGQR